MTQKNILTRSVLLMAAGTSFFLSSCDKDDDTPAQANTISDIVVAGSSFTSLEAAVLKANLQGTLSGTGPFTVFA